MINPELILRPKLLHQQPDISLIAAAIVACIVIAVIDPAPAQVAAAVGVIALLAGANAYYLLRTRITVTADKVSTVDALVPRGSVPRAAFASIQLFPHG